jgi:hypothetical protein
MLVGIAGCPRELVLGADVSPMVANINTFFNYLYFSLFTLLLL